MQAKEFMNLICEIQPRNTNAASVWIKWSTELSYYDMANCHRTGSEYKSAEMYLEEYAEHLRSIRANYGDGVARQIVSLAELYSCPMPWEMEGAARFLAAGGDLDEILEMEYAGTLEDYSPECVPSFA